MTTPPTPPKSFPVEQTSGMRAELDQLVNTWVDRGWSMEAASGTLIGYSLHLVKAGGWQTIEQIVTTIRSAWPLMKVSNHR